VRRDEVDLPDELYGFGGWLLWLVATRTPELVDQVYAAGLAHRSAEYGSVDGHDVPTASLIAWLIVAAENGMDVSRLAERTPEMIRRQKSLRTLASRALGTDPRAFQIAWLRSLAGLCGFTEPEFKLLVDSRDDGPHPVDPRALRKAIERSFRSATEAANGHPATRTLPRDVAAFTGRAAELRSLIDTVGAADVAIVQIYAIGGMAGVGKTAFATHAAHRLAERFPDGQIFFSLNGHTPGQRPVDPADALGNLLLTVGADARSIPPGLEARMRLWRNRLDGKRVLLVLDDATGHDQVSPLLPATPGSLVLITSRRRLTALQDARAISLDTLPPGDAAELFVRLADRACQDPADVSEIVTHCGYLPLAIGMLARQFHHHPAWTAASLAAELAAAADRLSLLSAEDRSVSAAFDLSYAALTPELRQLLRRLSLHPGADIDAWAAAALDESSASAARRGLNALYDQHLLLEPGPGRFRMHDLVREYAAKTAEADDAAIRDAALDRLLSYYTAAAQAAETHLTWHRRPRLPGAAAARARAAQLPPLHSTADAARWMAAEQPSLEAAIRTATNSGHQDQAIAILAAMHDFLETRGLADQGVVLSRQLLASLREDADRETRVWLLTNLGVFLRSSGQLHAAIETFTEAAGEFARLETPGGEAAAYYHLGWAQYLADEYLASAASSSRALDLYRAAGDELGEADALTNLGYVQYAMDEYAAAAGNLEQAIALYTAKGDLWGQPHAWVYLGSVQQIQGDLDAAAKSFTRGLSISQANGDRRREATARNNLAYLLCLLGRPAEAVDVLTVALVLQRELGQRLGEANSLNYLGLARRLTGDLAAAATCQEQAIALYQAAGSRLGEANAWQQLGLARRDRGDFSGALADQERALALYRDIDDRVSQAEVLNNIGDILLTASDLRAARERYELALALVAQTAAPMERARALEGLARTSAGRHR
jgi:tetratricopeptide (TPR) repeat protein